MRRALAHGLFVTLLSTVGAGLGVVTAMTTTRPGRTLLARVVSEELAGVLRGRMSVSQISGSFLHSLRLQEVVVRDTSGGVVATVPSVRVTYSLPQLLAGQVVLTSVRLDSPQVWLRQTASGRLNMKEVLRLGEGDGRGRSPLILFRNVRINDATVRVNTPWHPDDSLTSEAGIRRQLAIERAKLGRVIEETAEGFRKIVTIRHLTARFRQVTASTPDHDPLTIDIDSLYADVSDPQIALRQVVGRIQVPGDSLVFSLEEGRLPRSTLIGGGVVVFRDGTQFFDFTFTAVEAALTDFLWVSRDFPDLRGSAVLAARTESRDRSAFVLRNLDLVGADGSSLAGQVTVVKDDRRGIGFRDIRVHSERLDLDAVRPYIPALPFVGNLTGGTGMSGYLDGLRLNADWVFVDTSDDSLPVTELVGGGTMHGDDSLGLVFDSVEVRRADIALRTVRELAPAVLLEGRLQGVGQLSGPLRNATFVGLMRHQDGARPASSARGRFRLDTRGDTLAFAVDADLERLDFSGIRRGFPAIRATGQVAGHVQMEGPVTRLALDVGLSGQLGSIELEGTASLLPERLGGSPVRARFANLDLARLGVGPATSLTGSAVLDGVDDVATEPDGGLVVTLGPGSVEEFAFDSAVAAMGVRGGVLELDTLDVEWPRGQLSGGGTLGWRLPRGGAMLFALRSDSLGVFDSLVATALGVDRDSATVRRLDGLLEGRLELSGALDALAATGRGTVVDLVLDRNRADAVRGSLAWTGGIRPSLAVDLQADSLTIGSFDFPGVAVRVEGSADSLAWWGAVDMTRATRLEARGSRVIHPRGQRWRLDTLAAQLVVKQWDLRSPTVLELSDDGARLSGLDLAARDGSGFLRVVPRGGEDEFTVEALGLGIRDLYGLLQRDTTGVGGSFAASLVVGGTRKSPRIAGTAQVADATLIDFQGPLGRAVINYAERRLETTMLLWRTGEPVLRVDARVPIDLALTPMADRRVPGSLDVRVVADSVDLGVFDAFTSSVSDLRGLLVADMQVAGTWDQPRLAGSIGIEDARAGVPGLGVSFSSILGRAHFVGDSIVIDTLRVGSEDGFMTVTGSVRMEGLARPLLDLDIRAQNLMAIDVRDFLTLSASGRVRLGGSFRHPVLTGEMTADRGVLYFADLVNKQVLDLEDPANAELVDLAFIRERHLGSRFQNRFIDSLRIVDMDLRVRDDFYLRSNEANVLLEGDLTVNKVRREYRLAGELKALRGRYDLRIGNIVTRSFEVQRGTIRYFGTPDLDAQIDIVAEHKVTPVDRGEQIPIVATITGTMHAPRLKLTNRDGPPISESDLVSYLMFGKPSFDLSGGQNQTSEEGALAWGLAALSSALSSEVERTLISDIGLPIDYLQIRPGATPVGGSSVASTRISAGWRLTRRVFITLSAGFCPNDRLLNYKALGASLEWRFSRRWRSSVSLEPVEACELSTQADVLDATRYQIGVDLLWEKEY